MEFNEKLQELRKKKGLTQEELSRALFVSRTAVSKWESGRGTPGIDSLKAIASFFGVTIDELLSGEELLSFAQENSKRNEKNLRDLIYGLVDLSAVLLFFLPFFREKSAEGIRSVSLFALSHAAPYLKSSYVLILAGMILWGILTLTFQSFSLPLWKRWNNPLSLGLSIAAIFLFVISLQPYAASFTFVFFLLKALMLIRRP